MWAIGAQNAGKSTLINSIRKHVGEGGGKITHLTEAPVPGTTLEWGGKLFDTPGLLHPHQITTRLTREEQKLVRISKELRLRTYKIKVCFCLNVSRLILIYLICLFKRCLVFSC